MADFVLRSLRGGLNNSDPAIAIGDDQCRVATNVEFHRSMLGERRQGTDGIDLETGQSDRDRVSLLYRHLPSSDPADAQLLAVAFTNGDVSPKVRLKNTIWNEVVLADIPNLTGLAPYQWAAASFNGKLFIARDTNVDRLHVLPAGTFTERRAGLDEVGSAPAVADTGAGSFDGDRYYRVRAAELSGSTVLRRGEPSNETLFNPAGTGSAARITKPTMPGEGETHWELEASLDNANYYRIATIAVGTTTYDDDQAYADGYSEFPLSADIGDYETIPSGKYLAVDGDRLLIAGSWHEASEESRVRWTPVGNADGVGNDERLEADTDPYLDLDNYRGGPITGMSNPVIGNVWVFKRAHIYKLIRSTKRSAAYNAILYTDQRGAIHGSVVEGVDQHGRPCIYFLDPQVGPCRIGANGIEQCGADIRTTWETVNLDAAQVACSGVYYAATRQVIWCVATEDSDIPNLALVLQTNETRNTDDGVRRGWSVWTGTRASALTMCLYSDNIDANVDRNQSLVPFIGLEGLGLIHRCDTGDDDNGTAYAARIVSKPFTLKSLLTQFEVTAGAVLAKAVTGATVDVKVIRDFGLETTKTVSGVTFDATGSETDVIKLLDNLTGAEMRVGQFEFVDPATPGTRFELNQLTLLERPGQGA